MTLDCDYTLEVTATQQEKASGKWSSENLRKLLSNFTDYGVVVLQNVIDTDQLDRLNGPMVEDAKKIRADAKRLNFGTENIQQAPILDQEDVYAPDIYENRLLFEAVLYILGPDAKYNFLSGNAAMPGGVQTRQPVHADEASNGVNATFSLIANVPLIDFSIENGATEIWPGTHRLRDEAIFDFQDGGATSIKQEVCQERRKQYPPIQYPVKKGSIVLRDITLWHAGMPNTSDTVRCMIALGFCASWWKCQMSFPVPSKEMQQRITQAGSNNGLVVHTRVADNYSEIKDLHDFSFSEVA